MHYADFSRQNDAPPSASDLAAGPNLHGSLPVVLGNSNAVVTLPTESGSTSAVPVSQLLSVVEKVRKEGRELSASIFSDHAQLQGAIQRHEGLIRKRWQKKNLQQRKQILQAVWPDIAASHRPDLEAALNFMDKKRSDPGPVEHYLLPRLNLEDLIQTKNFLMFIHSRGRNLPHVFAHADSEAMYLGLVVGAFQDEVIVNNMMLLYGQTTPSTYGNLVHWSKYGKNPEKYDFGCALSPTHGIRTLRAQRRLYKFLLCCCRDILHDRPSDFLDESIPVKPEPGSLDSDTNPLQTNHSS